MSWETEEQTSAWKLSMSGLLFHCAEHWDFLLNVAAIIYWKTQDHAETRLRHIRMMVAVSTKNETFIKNSIHCQNISICFLYIVTCNSDFWDSGRRCSLNDIPCSQWPGWEQTSGYQGLGSQNPNTTTTLKGNALLYQLESGSRHQTHGKSQRKINKKGLASSSVWGVWSNSPIMGYHTEIGCKAGSFIHHVYPMTQVSS